MADNRDEEELGWVTCGNCGTKNPPTKDDCKNCSGEI